nr:MAG TPA: hypothetical protein [Caudoviricetes sp.]
MFFFITFLLTKENDSDIIDLFPKKNERRNEYDY